MCPQYADGMANSVDPDPNIPKFWDGQVWAKTSASTLFVDQGLHCLPFRLDLLNALLYGKPLFSNFKVITANISGVQIF